MDLSQIKKITMPEGDVKSISVGGVVIWQEQSKVLTSITLSGQTTSLNRGATFSFGGTVTAHYSDSSTEDVTSSTTFSGYNMSSAGTYTVTASYTENGVTKTATYSLTVNQAWSTVWSGSKTVAWSGSTSSGTSSKFASTASGTGTTPKIRVTFSTSGSWYFYNTNTNTSGSSSKPSSPLTINSLSNTYLVGSGTGSNTKKFVYLQKVNDTTNNRVQFTLWTGSSGGSLPSGNCSLTITKIEQYY